MPTLSATPHLPTEKTPYIMSRQPVISLEHISVSYGTKRVLTDVCLTVGEKDFLGIIGPNGGGKTTLIKTILGLKKADTGNITYFKDGKQVPQISIGYLPQYNKIDKNFPISTEEVILSGIRKGLFSRYTTDDREAARQVLQQMGIEDLATRPIGTLSGGQVQRALLGRAVISKPSVVILDEPNTYIDKRFEGQLYHLLEDINRESAVILVSHDIGAVLQNVRTIACVNETLDYHPDTELPDGWIEARFNCPIDLIGHGDMPHRILKSHKHR